uniref:Uncharacterized protein n=1 Tax=Desulfacinum infernum TaxID=35837 RepID=A0A831ZSQ2_9BACT
MKHWAVMWVLIMGFLAVGGFSAAHADHRKSSDHGILGKIEEHASKGDGEDHGNEGTGQAAAWLFAVGNFPVAGTVLLRRFVLKRTAGEAKKRAAEWYAWFKRHLMPVHYVLNPIALLTALIHFKLSWCRSTNVPEWSLLLVFVVGLMGLSMKFRLLPQPVLRSVRWVHTNPIVVAAVFGLLFLGHQALD